MVMCWLTGENKKECKNKKVWFTEDVKQPFEAGMMCTIDGDTFFYSQRIPGSDTQVHYAISPTIILAYMTSLTSMSQSKVALILSLLWRRTSYKSRYIKSWGLNGYTLLWPMKFCPKAGANLFFWNNIVVNTQMGDIVLDHWIKTHDDWVAGFNFLPKANKERAVSATTLPKRNINDLHIESGHPSETITQATTKALGIQVTGTFKPCEDCTLGKAKQWAISKKAVPCSKIVGERVFFYISSPSTSTLCGMHYWLLVLNDFSNCIWSFFLKEKSDLAKTMLGLGKNLKIKFNMQIQHFCCDNAGKN